MLKLIPSEGTVTGHRRKKGGRKAQVPPKIQSKMTIELKDQKKLMKVVARKMIDFADSAHTSDDDATTLVRGLQRSIMMVQKQRMMLMRKKKRK